MNVINENTSGLDWYPFLKDQEVAVFDVGNLFVDAVAIKVILSVLLIISMTLSLVGNVCTCVVVARDSTMRTPTNCYLLNLAVTDLIITMTAPVEVNNLWRPFYYPLGKLGCRIHFILWDCLSNCSVLTIVAFTVERYLVVSKPFLRSKLTLKSRVYKIIAINWLISLFFSVPDVYYIQLQEQNNYIYCSFRLTNVFRCKLPIDLMIFFVIPMTVITVLYILIAIKLKSGQKKLRSRSGLQNQNADKAVKMLAAVAATFFLCWAPYCMLRIILLGPMHFIIRNYNAWRVLYCLCSINISISTAVNPILYSFMSRKFRQAFKDILKGESDSRSRWISTFNSIGTSNNNV